MKTYFIGGRSKEFESISNRLALSDSESRSEPVPPDPATSISQHASFRKVGFLLIILSIFKPSQFIYLNHIFTKKLIVKQ